MKAIRRNQTKVNSANEETNNLKVWILTCINGILVAIILYIFFGSDKAISIRSNFKHSLFPVSEDLKGITSFIDTTKLEANEDEQIKRNFLKAISEKTYDYNSNSLFKTLANGTLEQYNQILASKNKEVLKKASIYIIIQAPH